MGTPRKSVSKLWLIANRPRDEAEARNVFADAGFVLLDRNPDTAGSECDVVVVLLNHDRPEARVVSTLPKSEPYPPPIVVFGPPEASEWRREALEAGAFACLSGDAPRSDKLALIGAANRYRAAQREIELIRRETDIVVQGLLQSYGGEAQKLQKVVKEAQLVRESLEDVQNRIIRSML